MRWALPSLAAAALVGAIVYAGPGGGLSSGGCINCVSGPNASAAQYIAAQTDAGAAFALTDGGFQVTSQGALTANVATFGPIVFDGGVSIDRIRSAVASGSVAISLKAGAYVELDDTGQCDLQCSSGNMKAPATQPYSNSTSDLGVTGTRWRNLYLASQVFLTAGDSTASPGNAVSNTPAGKSALAAGASAATITDSLVASTSVVMLTPIDVDATCVLLKVVSGTGSFLVTGTSAAGVATNCTATTKFNWVVFN